MQALLLTSLLHSLTHGIPLTSSIHLLNCARPLVPSIAANGESLLAGYWS